MTYPQALVIPVTRQELQGESVLLQDITNGQVAESMSDSELAFAVLDIAADQPAFGMPYAILEEAARRLHPDQFAGQISSSANQTSHDAFIPKLGWLFASACVGSLITIVSVYLFVTHVLR